MRRAGPSGARLPAMLSTVDTTCPYCGEPIGLVVDASAGDQHYVEDCAVCCRPIVVALEVDDEGDVAVRVRAESEA